MTTIFYNGKERKLSPLLMKPELVAQTLLGVKTETRRLSGLDKINIEPDNFKFVNNSIDWPDMPRLAKKYDRTIYYAFNQKHSNQILFVCNHNYGRVGDILWIRETWCDYNKENTDGLGPHYIHKANFLEIGNNGNFGIWKPNLHMPFAACRLFLEIIDVGLQRLQDITEEDAIREGIQKLLNSPYDTMCYRSYAVKGGGSGVFPYVSFETLWKSINGKESWDNNPWVWRIVFKIVEIDNKTATIKK